jgi:tagaturonate reductase
VNLQGRENGQPVNTLQRIDVISRALNPYSQNQAFMALAEQPEIRFVISNTTEAGIAFDDKCKLTDAPASSYPGKLVQLLYHRYQYFNGDPTKGFIIFPCELIFLNGHVLKECIYKYIDLWELGEDFKKWFTDNCGVYATLVDRIVPGFPRNQIKEIQQKISYKDNLVVQAENFHLWVIEAPKEIEKEFPADKAGLHVLFVPSEEPYHKRKVTLLNGPHTVLSPVAYLSGVNIVRDACNHEVIGKYIHKVQFDELMQTLDLPMDELKKFAADVLERFDNPYVDHQVTSIMLNSFPKFCARDLPGVKTYLERKGELPQGLVFGLAAIITYYKGGKRADGSDITPNDAQNIMDLLKELWATDDTQKITDGVLSATFIWGEDLNNIKGLNALVKKDLDLIQAKGMLEAVKTIL